MGHVFNIIEEEDHSRLVSSGHDVAVLTYFRGLYQFSFKTHASRDRSIKKVMGFVEAASANRKKSPAIKKGTVIYSTPYQHEARINGNKLYNQEIVDGLCRDKGVLGIRFSTEMLSVDVESGICEPGYIVLKKRHPKQTTVRIRAGEEVSRELSDLMVTLRAGGLKNGSQYQLETMLNEMVKAYQK